MLKIALAFSPECEEELIKQGFTKQEVYVKHFLGNASDENVKAKAEREFWMMKAKPFQFTCIDYWGAGPE